MRRLFSNFAHGAPGTGLLLMRVVSGAALLFYAVPALAGAKGIVSSAFSAGLGLLLLAGLWTPIVGMIVAIDASWRLLSRSAADPWYWLFLGSMGAALALLGPGSWSVDAHLFGWKRIEIPSAKSQGAKRRD